MKQSFLVTWLTDVEYKNIIKNYRKWGRGKTTEYFKL